jgi:predicted amidohydrolase YtcJ
VSILIANGRIAGRPTDLRIVDGHVSDIGSSLGQMATDVVVQVNGGEIIKGLHDHHVHLRALAALSSSIFVGPPAVTNKREFFEVLRDSSRSTDSEWIRAVGYFESVAGDLDRHMLDAAVPNIPVRVQHRSGGYWVVNSIGAASLQLDAVDLPGIDRDGEGRPTGRLFRMDHWLADQVRRPELRMKEASMYLASRGVTGITEATPGATTAGIEDLFEYVDAGDVVQRLHVMMPHDVELIERRLVTRGPVKVMLDDENLPTIDDLSGQIHTAHLSGVPVAIHCVTTAQMVVALESLRLAGNHPGDRIEHASLISEDMFSALKDLQITVITNPAFVLERGDDYLHDVEASQHQNLYRCGSLLRTNIRVAVGTDAPFASADPWSAIGAAVSRRTASGQILSRQEAVSLPTALRLFMGPPHSPGSAPLRIARGDPADLCVLARKPTCRNIQDVIVLMTMIAGKVVYHIE